MAIQSPYAQRMARLAARIFVRVPPHQKNSSGLDPKVTRIFSEKPLDKKPEIVKYYPRHIELTSILSRLRNIGLFRDEHADFKDEIKRTRALRGKVKPKKGEGKRSAKKLS